VILYDKYMPKIGEAQLYRAVCTSPGPALGVAHLNA